MVLLEIVLFVGSILISLTVHEFAHGYAAWMKGDNTAKSQGRLSLNPLSHLDLWGSITFLVTFIVFRMPFGWAKPVPVNPMNLDNPRKDMVFVSFAGPFSNMILALISGYLIIIPENMGMQIHPLINQFLFLMVIVNIGLSWFNLLPLPPLDGSNIVRGLLPPHKVMAYIRFTQYVPQIFLVLFLVSYITHTSILGKIFKPLIDPYYSLWSTIIFGGRIMF